MKTGWTIAFSVVSALLAAGLLYLAVSPPRGQAITLLPPPTPMPLIVQVSGAVNKPGLYPLSAGSRVQDALNAAGGLAENADPNVLNLAAIIQDGQRIDVPALQPTPPPLPAGAPTLTPVPGWTGSPTHTASSTSPASSAGLININTASQAELESLPYIGPSLAQRIIEYREQNGPFKSIEDIQKVKGIGPAIFAKIKDLITV